MLATKTWFTFNGRVTTAYITVQYLKMPVSKKTRKYTDLICSCLKVHDLGILLCLLYLISFSHLNFIVWGIDSTHGIFNSQISRHNILLIKFPGDINPVRSYPEANLLKICRLVSWWFFLNFGLTTGSLSFCLFQPRPSAFVLF